MRKAPRARSPPTTTFRGIGSSSWSGGTSPRARPPSNLTPDARTPARTRSRPVSRTRSFGSAKELSRQGLSARADTIRTHLARRTPRSQTSSKTAPPSVSTIWRILARRGFLTPQPQKRPRSSWHRFEAEQPNQRWQADTTHWQLADGTPIEILDLLDDHSRLAVACVSRRTITGPDVVGAFGDAFVRWGIPASVLTDNRAIFTGLPRRGGRVALEIELGRLGVRFDHSRANHPQTQGKVERFGLRAQPL